MNKKSAEDKQTLDGKIFAVLSYLSILCIIPLIFKKDNTFALEHGKQGLVLFVAEVTSFILHILLGVWFLYLTRLIFGFYSLVGIVKVFQGKYVNLFIVSNLARKISL